MRLSGLADALRDLCTLAFPEGKEGGNPVLTGVCSDSRRVEPGDLFLALPGFRENGLRFVREAAARGARAALGTPTTGLEIPFLIPLDGAEVARVAGEAAHTLAGGPSDSLMVLAVTGTNGKTTVVHLIHQALGKASIPAARCGTLGRCFSGKTQTQEWTTPPSDVLHSWLAEVQSGGGKVVALEASSHALAQDRLAGAAVDAAGWTNLTQDHLDYHPDPEAYARAKARLIHSLPAGAPAFLPEGQDSILGPCRGARAELVPWSLEGSAPLRGRAEFHPEGLLLAVEGSWGAGEIHSSLVGRHNAENLLLAWGLLRAAGLTEEEVSLGLSQAAPPEGRLERICPRGDRFLYVDFAHTPAALEEVLASIRTSHPGKKLGVVFGAGGDRDPGKRFPMGQAAASGSDWCIVTTDNARTESPEAIAEQVAEGVRASGREACIELDRRTAIRAGFEKTAPGDVLVVAGKGHETWQELDGVRHPFDDRLELEEAASCTA